MSGSDERDPLRDLPVSTASDAEWNAGDMGCGELVLELRGRLRAMPGRVLKLIALDPGAPEDVPAFCRMTTDKLLHYDASTHAFWIRARR